MIWLLLVNLSLGIEGGIEQPVLGYEDLKSGTFFSLILNGEQKGINVSIALQESFSRGRNPGYSYTSYGARLSLLKREWRVSPVIEFGPDYDVRALNQVREYGWAMGYSVGAVLMFKYESLWIYPKLSYDGATDFRANAGSLGLKLGLVYEFSRPKAENE